MYIFINYLTMSDAPTQTSSVDNDKMLAAVATIPLVGLIMYYGMSNISDFVKFYAKQSIGLLILSVIVSLGSFFSAFLFFIPFVGGLLSLVFTVAGIVVFVLWLVALINALQGNKYELPVVSNVVNQLIK